MTITASPDEYCNPASVAICCPKRRENFRSLQRELLRRCSMTTSSVRSGEGSMAKMIS